VSPLRGFVAMPPFAAGSRPRLKRFRRRAANSGWNPVALAYNDDFSAKELNRVRLVDHIDQIWEAWDEHCGS
jgi:hypothetical protein